MWEHRVLEEVSDGARLPGALDALMAQQRETWDALREGEAALKITPTRPLAHGDAALTLQANERRSGSTLARTDAASIADRPCFLCEINLPPQERAVVFDDLVLMPNPFPAVACHLTGASREHVPQRLAQRTATLHRLARALGEDWFVLYNGPRCGASAPDHFHFQCGRVHDLPVFGHSQIDSAIHGGVLAAGGRTALHIRTRDEDAASAEVARALDVLPRRTQDEEPLVNVLSSWRCDHYVTLVFPRTRHRPDAYYAREGRLAISPAALEMAGLVIVSDPDQYQQVNATILEAMFAEVCMTASDAGELWS